MESVLAYKLCPLPGPRGACLHVLRLRCPLAVHLSRGGEVDLKAGAWKMEQRGRNLTRQFGVELVVVTKGVRGV